MGRISAESRLAAEMIDHEPEKKKKKKRVPLDDDYDPLAAKLRRCYAEEFALDNRGWEHLSRPAKNVWIKIAELARKELLR